MKLTRASHYALIALTHMAQQQDIKNAVASHDIAYEHHIPERFLLKVLQPLVSEKILRSCKGPNGGYVLNRLPSEITMLEIIEAVEHNEIEGDIPPPYQPNPKNESKAQKGKESKDKKQKKERKPPNPANEKNNVPINNKLRVICKENAGLVREHLGKVRLSDLAKKESRSKVRDVS